MNKSNNQDGLGEWIYPDLSYKQQRWIPQLSWSIEKASVPIFAAKKPFHFSKSWHKGIKNLLVQVHDRFTHLALSKLSSSCEVNPKQSNHRIHNLQKIHSVNSPYLMILQPKAFLYHSMSNISPEVWMVLQPF